MIQPRWSDHIYQFNTCVESLVYVLLRYHPVSWHLRVFCILCVLVISFFRGFYILVRAVLQARTFSHYLNVEGFFFFGLFLCDLSTETSILLFEIKKKENNLQSQEAYVVQGRLWLVQQLYCIPKLDEFCHFFLQTDCFCLARNTLPLQRAWHDPPWHSQNAPSVASVQIQMPVAASISLPDWKKKQKEVLKGNSRTVAQFLDVVCFCLICTKVIRTNSFTISRKKKKKKRFSLRLIAFIWQVAEIAVAALHCAALPFIYHLCWYGGLFFHTSADIWT